MSQNEANQSRKMVQSSSSEYYVWRDGLCAKTTSDLEQARRFEKGLLDEGYANTYITDNEKNVINETYEPSAPSESRKLPSNAVNRWMRSHWTEAEGIYSIIWGREGVASQGEPSMVTCTTSYTTSAAMYSAWLDPAVQPKPEQEDVKLETSVDLAQQVEVLKALVERLYNALDNASAVVDPGDGEDFAYQADLEAAAKILGIERGFGNDTPSFNV